MHYSTATPIQPMERPSTFAAAAQKISALGVVLYAIRVEGGLIKIGSTKDLYARWRQLKRSDGAVEVLAFRFGSRNDERDLHRTLAEHAEHGREYYRPEPAVLAIVNRWRHDLGRAPITA